MLQNEIIIIVGSIRTIYMDWFIIIMIFMEYKQEMKKSNLIEY